MGHKKKLNDRRENSAKQEISLYEMIKYEARRFCLETGLNGFKYIAKSDSTPVERITWTIICFGALILALTLSILSWIYSTASPTVTATDSMHHALPNFLYPAISICNLNKISRHKATQFVKETLKVEDKYNISYWRHEMQLLAQMYYANYDTTESRAYNKLQDLLDEHKITAEEALLTVTPSCRELLQSCMWKGTKYRCDSLFQKTRTPTGICCTFNNYAARNFLFHGYMPERYKITPRKLAACGHKTGMNVIVRIDPNDYLVSELSAYGTKVIIHDSMNYPDWSAQRVLIPTNEQIYIDIDPVKTYATESVRAMKGRKRGCIFRDENKLKICANYTYENCLTECRIRILEKACGCMPFYYRNVFADWTPPLRICNLRDIACMSANKPRFLSSVPGFDVYLTKNKDHIWGSEQGECNCLPDCENRIYWAHSTRGILSSFVAMKNRKFYGALESRDANFSVISIFFKDLIATRVKRDVSLSWSANFGLFGGLLGICLGFTIIAGFDVIYTFTIRLAIDYYEKTKILSKIAGSETKQKKNFGKKQKPDLDIATIYEPFKQIPENYNDPPPKYFRRRENVWFLN